MSSDIQASSVFSDLSAQIESRFNLSHPWADIHDPSARVAGLTTFNNGIDAARQFLRSLLTRHNALVPISLLPPEILARIFHLLVPVELPFSGSRNLGWIKVTHVCRHWRQVALDDSSLWARIWVARTNRKWISKMLARAKSALLDIEFNAVGRSSPEALLTILSHLSHTRKFCSRNLSLLHFDSVRKICHWEAPALEHFELTSTAYPPITFRHLEENPLFKGHAPRLRTFSLSRVIIPWSLIPRGQLTQLKIACPDDSKDLYSPGDLNQLIDLLVNCPALEILALEFCLPSQITEFQLDRTIHFRHLSHLRLRDPTSRIMNMLKMLKLPPSTTLHLDCIAEIISIHNDLEGPLLPVISAHFQGPSPVEFKSLTVAIHGHRPLSSSLNIIASTSILRNRQIQISEGDIVGNAELVLSFDRLFNSTDLLGKACKMLPILNLEFISMSATDINDTNINWIELFGCCTNVTTMQVIGHGASGLVRALTAPTATNAGSGRVRKRDNKESTTVQPDSTVARVHAAIFPNLESLGLTQLNPAKGKHPSSTLFNVLERGLKQRLAASGAALKFLRISDCDISAMHAKRLQNLVQDFHWDENKVIVD